MGQHVARPSVLGSRRGVPKARGGVVELFQQCDLVVPGQCCKRRLQHWKVRPCLGEALHVPQVPGGGEAFCFREPCADVGGQAGDHLGSPALLGFTLGELPADTPVRIQQLAIGGCQRPGPADTDLLSTVLSSVGVPVGHGRSSGGHPERMPRWRALGTACCSCRLLLSSR